MKSKVKSFFLQNVLNSKQIATIADAIWEPMTKTALKREAVTSVQVLIIKTVELEFTHQIHAFRYTRLYIFSPNAVCV